MYSSTFIFAKKQFDDDFYRLDHAIAVAAKEIPGYLGEEAWENPSNGLVSNRILLGNFRSITRFDSTPKTPGGESRAGKLAGRLSSHYFRDHQVLW